MIDLSKIYIVNYCHKNCEPLKNIMRLPKNEAFDKAKKLAHSNKKTTAFYRFSDFANYYPLRLKTDEILYDKFIRLKGNPQTRHPLSFVLQENEYLKDWFDEGYVTKLNLKCISDEFISFTYGDSSASVKRENTVKMITKEMLFSELNKYNGTINEFLAEIKNQYGYIEAQLWNDEYCIKQK